MRGKFLSIESKKKYVLHWILIYILILIIGFIISYASTYISNKDMRPIAEYDLWYYEETGQFNPNVEVNGAHNYIYDENGNRITGIPDKPLSPQWDEYTQKIRSKVHENGSYYTVAFRIDKNLPAAIVLAYPLEDGDTFIFFREAHSFFRMMLIIRVTVGILIVMIATYMYLVMSMQQKNQKMQRGYVDNITHELKSPIASVRALTETMYDGLIQDEEKRKRYYKIILNEMKGLENTVSNMLELSKIQNNQIDCSKTVISTYDVFGEVVEKYAALCDERGMKFSITPSLSGKWMVYTNPSLASRIMDILLDNAVKFAGENGSVRIEFEDDGAILTISIIDSGTGIAPADQAFVFSRFYKGDKSHNEKGSGLGLSIATEIADSLGEKLWLKSSSSEGSEFAFTIQKS